MTIPPPGAPSFTGAASFVLRFTATPRGARLARRLASQQLDSWGRPYRTPAHDAVELVVAELAANAVTHGRVPGRDAELRLAHDGGSRVLVEVSDVRDERLPVLAPEPDRRPLAEDGRGLALVSALAEAWGVAERPGAPGKTVWAVMAAAPAGRPESVVVHRRPASLTAHHRPKPVTALHAPDSD
ncbi:ATP-binding protein [Streptomyces hydrogenans]|uniref:ATP-binding protein n=1 Tax=Streptomyces hydrogenans TaxID=1873719 RepID=UPI00380F44B4